MNEGRRWEGKTGKIENDVKLNGRERGKGRARLHGWF